MKVDRQARIAEIRSLGWSYEDLVKEKAVLEEIIAVQEDIIDITDRSMAREEAFRRKETRRKRKWMRRAMRYQVMAYIAVGVSAVACIFTVAVIARLYSG